MNTKKGVLLLLSICGIGLLVILAIFLFPLPSSKNNTETAHYKVMEIHTVSNSSDKIYGIVEPKITTTVAMKINGRITEDNRSLSVGSTVKKDEIIIKMERLDGLYKLLKERNQYKEAVQEALPKIEKQFPAELEKWSQFEKNIHGVSALPDLPKIKTNKEHETISQLGLLSQYYAVKNTHQWIENHFYTAPFDGTIIKTNVTAGSTVKKGKTILEIAKNGNYRITAVVPIDQLATLKNTETVYYLDAKEDTLGKGHYLKTAGNISDSASVKVYFSCTLHQPKFIGTPVTLIYPQKKRPIGTSIPKTAVVNDSVMVLSNNKLLQLAISILSHKKDSVSVVGLPHHCFVVVNPKE